MTRANGWKSLTNIKKNSISDPARVLDPTVIIVICPLLPKELKDAEATCVEIVTEVKKCFRLKGMLDFNVLCDF